MSSKLELPKFPVKSTPQQYERWGKQVKKLLIERKSLLVGDLNSYNDEIVRLYKTKNPKEIMNWNETLAGLRIARAAKFATIEMIDKILEAVS